MLVSSSFLESRLESLEAEMRLLRTKVTYLESRLSVTPLSSEQWDARVEVAKEQIVQMGTPAMVPEAAHVEQPRLISVPYAAHERSSTPPPECSPPSAPDEELPPPPDLPPPAAPSSTDDLFGPSHSSQADNGLGDLLEPVGRSSLFGASMHRGNGLFGEDAEGEDPLFAP